MPIVAALPSNLVGIPVARLSIRRQRQCPKYFVSPVMKDDSNIASPNDQKNIKEGITTRSNRRSEQPRIGYESKPSNLRFDRLQPPDEELDCKLKRAFGLYIAREALLDEEFWTAAWLRAESQWEDKPGTRHVDTFKRQFAEQEFNAIKRRHTQQLAQKSTCIIVEHIKGLSSCSISGRKYQPIYGYVANLSVAKYARRQAIASNMLLLAVEATKSYGANEVFIHVHKDNMAAQKLYEKLGFEMVEKARSQSLEDKKFLLCMKTA